MSCGKPSCKPGGCAAFNAVADHTHQPPSSARSGLNPNLCVKCKINDAVAGGAAGGEDGRFCPDCFRGSLFGKFRLAVTSNAMISPSDKLLLAFSAGPCSRVALQFIHEMQDKAQRNFDASRDKSFLSVFSVGVAFVDETFARSLPPNEASQAIQLINTVMSDLAHPSKQLHITPLESIYASDLSDGRVRLRELLNAVTDYTGRDDLLIHLRMLCLQKVAVDNGYTKLVLGSCTSTIARHVLSATVKGHGYSLPADIQFVDARWEVPVLLPLRDCLAQELNVLCQLDGLKTLATLNGSQVGINGLISSFVSLLQQENPSRECTIVRTAGKLTPFSFNSLPIADDPNAHLASQRRQKKFNMKSDKFASPESFCSLCCSPLHKSDSASLDSSTGEEKSDVKFDETCCSSCRFQILPGDPSSLEPFCSLLPRSMISRSTVRNGSSVQSLLREKIQDFLLSDGEDGP